MRQFTKEGHHISRFLTRPWQDKEGRLFSYDFDRDTFDWSSSRSLFADDELLDPYVAAWLAETIEGPLNAVRPRLASKDPTAVDDTKFIKAAVLMIWLQGGWFQADVDEEVRQDMNRLAAMSTDELDGLVAAFHNDLALRLVFTSSETSIAPIFVPSSVIFPFPFTDPGCVSGHSVGIGLPLDVQCAAVLLPADRASEADQASLGPMLSNCSIGPSESKRVVLPPNLLGAMAERDAAQILKNQREQSEARVSDVRDIRQAVLAAFERVGFRARVDRTGRIVPPPA